MHLSIPGVNAPKLTPQDLHNITVPSARKCNLTVLPKDSPRRGREEGGKNFYTIFVNFVVEKRAPTFTTKLLKPNSQTFSII